MSTEASQLELHADREPAALASRAGRMLRVLHVGKYYPPVPGGMERVLQLLCEAERQLVDSRVLVVNTCAHTSREVCGGVPVTRAATLARIGSVGVSPALALELARTLRPAIVITEILVPRLDGLALCRRLKADQATTGTAVLIFSLLAAEGRASDAGDEAFLRQPLAAERLTDTVRKLLAALHSTPDGTP